MRPLSLLPLLALLGCASLTAIACGGDEGGEDDGGTGGTASGGSGTTEPPRPTVPGTCDNCSNGCCDGDTCIPFGSQSGAQCGSGGYVCVDCGYGALCDATGSCAPDPSICSALSCDGCCSGNTCISASDTSWEACGEYGDACFVCSKGAVCDGDCTAQVDPGAGGFRITIGTVTLAASNTLDGGATWDTFTGADPFVCVSNGVESDCTAYCTDALSCALDVELEVNITGQQLLDGVVSVTVYEDDEWPDEDDLAGTTYLTISVLDASYQTGAFGGVTNVTYTLE
jgi:hypothetical protein